MERFLCPKTGEDQRSFSRLRTIFMSEHTSSPKSNQTYSACQCQWGRGLFSILVPISVLRVLKTLYFAYSVCQCGEGYSSPRPPPLATLPAFGAWRLRPQSPVCATLSLLVTLHHWGIFLTKKIIFRSQVLPKQNPSWGACSLLYMMESDTTKFRLGCHHP